MELEDLSKHAAEEYALNAEDASATKIQNRMRMVQAKVDMETRAAAEKMVQGLSAMELGDLSAELDGELESKVCEALVVNASKNKLY